MNDFDIYDNEEVQNLQDTLKELRRLWNADHDKLEQLLANSPEWQALIKHRNLNNQAIRDTKRLLDDCIAFLKSIP